MISRAFDLVSRRIDGPLMAALALTLALGVTVVYSASGGSSIERVMGQGRNLAVAFVALWIFAHIHPQLLMRLAVPVYVAGLALLIGVALFGDIRNGARRWLNLGFTTLQPSEVMKIGVPLMLAWYFHRREEGLRLVDFAIASTRTSASWKRGRRTCSNKGKGTAGLPPRQPPSSRSPSTTGPRGRSRRTRRRR